MNVGTKTALAVALCVLGGVLAWQSLRLNGLLGTEHAPRSVLVDPPPDIAKLNERRQVSVGHGAGGQVLDELSRRFLEVERPEGVTSAQMAEAGAIVVTMLGPPLRVDHSADAAVKRQLNIAHEPMLRDPGLERSWTELAKSLAEAQIDTELVEARWVSLPGKGDRIVPSVGAVQRGERLGERFVPPTVNASLDRIIGSDHRALELRFPVRTRDKATGEPVNAWMGYRLVWDAVQSRWLVRSAITYSPQNNVVNPLPMY